MPNVRTHDIITVVSAAVMVPAALNSGLPQMDPVNTVALVGTYLASGLLFSPDLDTHSRPYRRWGVLRWIWLPYQAFVPHRSWVSHSFLLGPLLRVFYFAGVVALLTALALGLTNLMVPVDPTGTLLNLACAAPVWVEMHFPIIAYATVGLILGGASHTLADIVFSKVKRMF
jgi:uncharacterized metal-binding protein